MSSTSQQSTNMHVHRNTIGSHTTNENRDREKEKEKKTDFNWLDLWKDINHFTRIGSNHELHNHDDNCIDHQKEIGKKEKSEQVITDQGWKDCYTPSPSPSLIAASLPATYTPSESLPSLQYDVDASQQPSILLTPPTHSHDVDTPLRLPPTYPTSAVDTPTVITIPPLTPKSNLYASSLQHQHEQDPLTPSQRILSPFARLGLRTPQPAIQSPSPPPKPICTSVPSAPALNVESESELDSDWEPETPTPARYVSRTIQFDRPSTLNLKPLSTSISSTTPIKVERKASNSYFSPTLDNQSLSTPKSTTQPPAKCLASVKPTIPTSDKTALSPRRLGSLLLDPQLQILENSTTRARSLTPNPFQVSDESQAGAEEDVVPDYSTGLSWVAHLSTDGGLLPSLQRLISLKRQYPEIEGVSMFINPPKKRVRPSFQSQSDLTDLARWEQIARSRDLISSLGEEFRRNTMAHAVHTTNLLSWDEDLRDRSKSSIIAEMRDARELGIATVVIHLGSNRLVRGEHEMRVVLRRLVRDLNEIVEIVPEVTLALENTVHPSPNRLTSLKTLAALLPYLHGERIKLCIDLCHLHVAEIDLNRSSHYEKLSKLLFTVGREKIVGIHVSDSYVPHRGKGDRHANIGFGLIDLCAFRQVLRHPTLYGLPLLLETPKYHRYLRLSNSNSNSGSSSFKTKNDQIHILESQRDSLERTFVHYLTSMPQLDFENGGREKLWNYYKVLKRRVESKIYKLVRGQGGSQWERFVKARRKAGGYCRQAEGRRRIIHNRVIREGDENDLVGNEHGHEVSGEAGVSVDTEADSVKDEPL